METVPDMDALLDELEEVVVGSKSKFSKLSSSNVDRAVVIELPVNIKKLSEKEAIRMELKPPNSAFAIINEFSTTESVTLVAGKGQDTSEESSEGISTSFTRDEPETVEGEVVCDDICDKSPAEEGNYESDHDKEFEEALKYLDQFDEEDAEITAVTKNDMDFRVSAMSPSSDLEKTKRKTKNSKSKSISLIEEISNHEHDQERNVEMEMKDSHATTAESLIQQAHDRDLDSLQMTAEAVAESVLNATSAEGEFNDSDSEKTMEPPTVHFVENSGGSEQAITNCEPTLSSSGIQGDVNALPSEEMPTAVTKTDSVESTTSCSTDNASMVTVIHKPFPVCEDQRQSLKEGSRQEYDGEEPEMSLVEVEPDAQNNLHNDIASTVHPDTVVTDKQILDKQKVSLSRPESLKLSPEDLMAHPNECESVACSKAEFGTLQVGNSALEYSCVDDDSNELSAEDVANSSEPACANTSAVSCADSTGPSDGAGSDDSSHGLETAIECDTEGNDSPSPTTPRNRFAAQVISTIHDLSQETDPTRLTESELQLGKSKPYWIPDDDCSMCMLCNAKFSLLNRRHHCRACGRVACGACCKEKAILQYLKNDPKKQAQARVCAPCATMLARIEDHEKLMREHAEGSAVDEAIASTSGGARVARGVLKTRSASVGDQEADDSSATDCTEKKRSVVFRDGVKPGATSPAYAANHCTEEKSTTVKPKKKARKRHAVARRVAELRMEDELACALPTATRPQILVLSPTGEVNTVDEDWIKGRLKQGLSVTVMLKKNLSCLLKICGINSMSVFCVHSIGFATIGLDEVVFLWKRDDLEDFSVPLNVLHRVAQIYSTSCDADQAGVRQVCSRLPPINTVPIATPPLSRHILFYPPTLQDFSNVPIPSTPFLLALFLNDAELTWAMACPNRLLFRLGLKYGWYPCPVVNIIGREAVYTTETSQTVLKVFTDFQSWSFRMKHLAGSTVTLNNDVTSVEIPRSAKNDLREIISLNRKMLAWTTSVNLSADSHLVCDETNGFYSTQVLARESTRKATGASFLIIDGGMKTNGIQISVVEDGVAIRIPSEKLESLIQALSSVENWMTTDASGTQFIVRWTDGQSTEFAPKSTIDGQNLAYKFQYGLSLERAISSVLQVNSVADYGVRLSHVYNLNEGRLPSEDEPKVFSVAEMLARECTGMLEPYLSMLINMNIMNISIRVGVSSDSVEYEVSPWFGMEEEQLLYKQNMDQLIPVLYDILGYLSAGFNIELTLSFVSTKSLHLL